MLKKNSWSNPVLFLVPVMTLVLSVFVYGCGSDDPTTPGGDQNPPTVVFTTPVPDSEISGAVELAVSVTNTNLVRFYADNLELGSDSTAPFSYSWNSGLVVNGAHTLRARAEGSGGSKDSEISILVNNTAGSVIVTVVPNEISLETGQTQQFSATVTGAASTEVTWSVQGGAGWGTITSTGLYTAPSALPNPATATITATSVASPGNNGSSIVTLTGDGGGGSTAEQEEILSNLLFSGAPMAVDLGEDALEWMARSVWKASELNGGALTKSGTLTQVSAGSETFTYSASPADALVLVLVGSTPMEFTFTSFDGYLDGTWSDFLYGHRVDFQVTVSGSLELSIDSEFLPERDGTWNWTRSYAGWIAHDGQIVQLNLADSGHKTYETNYSFAMGETSEDISGTISTSEIAITVGQHYWTSLVHNSGEATEVRNFQLTTNSSATMGGHTYRYAGSGTDTPAGVRWDTYTSFQSDPPMYNVVDNPSYWIFDGGILKDGELFGLLQFSCEVLAGTWGPDLILHTQTGDDYFVHTLISGP